jgi:hypothetical protein
MIALAVTAGIVVYIYSSGLMGSLQGSNVQQPYSETITLDYYQWKMQSTANGTLMLDLRNTGSTQVTLTDFFIAGNPVNRTCFGSCSPYLNVNAPVMNVTLTYSGLTFTQGVSYNVRVVTQNGAVFDFACIAGTTS